MAWRGIGRAPRGTAGTVGALAFAVGSLASRVTIVAGNAAGCMTVAVSYGYLGDSGPLHSWGADLIIDRPSQLAEYLARYVGPK